MVVNMIGYNKDDLSLHISIIKTFKSHTEKDMEDMTTFSSFKLNRTAIETFLSLRGIRHSCH